MAAARARAHDARRGDRALGDAGAGARGRYSRAWLDEQPRTYVQELEGTRYFLAEVPVDLARAPRVLPKVIGLCRTAPRPAQARPPRTSGLTAISAPSATRRCGWPAHRDEPVATSRWATETSACAPGHGLRRRHRSRATWKPVRTCWSATACSTRQRRFPALAPPAVPQCASPKSMPRAWNPWRRRSMPNDQRQQQIDRASRALPRNPRAWTRRVAVPARSSPTALPRRPRASPAAWTQRSG